MLQKSRRFRKKLETVTIRRYKVKRESLFLIDSANVPRANDQGVASNGPHTAWRVRNSSAKAP